MALADNESVLGDLAYQEWARPVLDLEIEKIEVDPWEMQDVFCGPGKESAKDTRTRQKMSVVFTDLEKENSNLRRQFQFDFDNDFKLEANIVRSKKFYFDSFVDLYGKRPGPKSEAVFKELAKFYRKLLQLNKTLKYPMRFSYAVRKEEENEYLVHNQLYKPDEAYFEDYRESRKQGQDYISWLVELGNTLNE